MQVEDYFLTKEKFQLKPFKEGILETFPVPEYLDRYYDSEEYISHHQEKPSLKQFIYKAVQKFNLNYKRNILAKYVPKKSLILDYGMGAGDFLAFIRDDFSILGFEPSTAARKTAIQKIGHSHITEDVERLSDNSLDGITLWHVFEHLPYPTQSLELFRKKLKSDGFLFIAVPNFNSYDAQFYGSHWAAYDVPRHLFHYSQRGLQALLEDEGFELIQTKPLFFDSFYISLISEKYLKNPLFFLRGPFIGALSNLKASRSGEFSSLIYIFQKKN